MLVAHSYGGAVISNVSADAGEIIGLVYVNGFAPDPGESCFSLAGMFPGSTLGEETSQAVPRSDGTTDLYIAPGPLPRAVLRRRAGAAGSADGGDAAAGNAGGAHRTVRRAAALARAAVVVPDRHEDRIIPAELQRFMAERAGARSAVEIPGASHAVAVSQPQARPT